MREIGILLLFVVGVALPLFYLHAWLRKKLAPEKSFGRLFLFLLINFGVAALFILLFGIFIVHVFFPELKTAINR